MSDQQTAFAISHTELLNDEGNVLCVYDDATGKPISKGSTLLGFPTIGVGRNLATRGISASESEILLFNDQQQAWLDLMSALPWFAQLTPMRAAAIMSLYFNTSEGHIQRFVQGWPRLMAQMQAGDYEGAANNIEHAQPYATQVGGRAARLGAMIRYG
jgi:GH24 family phage-related lysozyme (muramidase)